MHTQKHDLHEQSLTKGKTRIGKIKTLGKLFYRESVCIHESGHTVMNILLHGEHEKQIQNSFGGVAKSSIIGLLHAQLTPDETIAILLAGFGAQEAQSHDLLGKKTLDYSLEHKYTPGLAQPDILFSLHFLRKEFRRKMGRKMSSEEQEVIIRELVNKIANFFQSHKKLILLINILAKKNAEKSVLNRDDINQCVTECGITAYERVEWANEIRNMGFFDFPNSSSPLSSPE